MEMVPILKKIEPTLDSQGRQEVIRDLWTRLKDQHKLAYVLMSRADREKVMYLARLNQIREELRRAYPEEALLKQIAELREGKKHPKDLTDSLNGNIHGLNALAKIEESMTEERQDEVHEDDEVEAEADAEFEVTCSSGFDASSMPQPGALNLSAEKRQALRTEVTTKLLRSFNQDAEPSTAANAAEATKEPGTQEALAESLLTDIANIVLEKKEPATAEERGDSIFADGSYVD